MKFSNTQTNIKIPITQLFIGENVRSTFDENEIGQLAESIRDHGLLSPINVKPPVEKDGIKMYEVICGERRKRAIDLLCSRGEDFSLVDCKITTGDTWALRMIENIQRVNLSPQEKEAAVAKMIEQGWTQSEIAKKLNKPISYVSDILAGAKVRAKAERAGIKTDNIGTRALAQLRTVESADIPKTVNMLAEAGGTNKAAEKITHEYKDRNTRQKPDSAVHKEEKLQRLNSIFENSPIDDNQFTIIIAGPENGRKVFVQNISKCIFSHGLFPPNVAETEVNVIETDTPATQILKN